MNGCILEGTPIVVDLWIRPDFYKVFFLTHLHSDHIKYLTSSWRFPFYTSPMNHLLLQAKFQFSDHIVIPLELHEPHIISTDAENKESFTVTLIDANHVPGAVMFLFQGQFGNILYCGDMRFYPELFEHPILSSAIESGIDRLYMDNTFAKPNCNFPTREEASEKVFRIIERHPNHAIRLGIRKLGKEDLLESIAQRYQELIYVDADKYSQLKILRRPNVYTTDLSRSRIYAMNMNFINIRSHQRWNETEPTISILLTGIYYSFSADRFPFADTEGFFVVPLSDHSSWQELLTLVRGVKPRKVIPIVKDSKKQDSVSLQLRGREDMSPFNAFLASPVSSPSYPRKLAVKDAKRQGTPVANLNLTPLLKIPKIRGEKIIRSRLKRKTTKGVLYVSFNESTTDDLDPKEAETSLDPKEAETSIDPKEAETSLDPKEAETSSLSGNTFAENELVKRKDLVAKKGRTTNRLQRSPLPIENPTQYPISGVPVALPNDPCCGEHIADVRSSCPKASSGSDEEMEEITNSRANTSSKSESTSKKLSKPVLLSAFSTPEWEDRQKLLKKAVRQTKCFTREMRKNPELEIHDVLRKGFEMCNILETVKDSF